MLVAPLPRRVLGLSAAGALVFGVTVLGTAGIAQATPSYTVSGTGTSSPVPTGICSIDWDLNGGSGGLRSDGTGGGGAGELTVTLAASAGDTFTLYPGTAGQNAVDGGAGGTNGYGDTTTAGTAAGDASSGGGGAASVVTKGGSLYLLAFGGDGSGAAPGSGGGAGTNRAPGADPTTFSSTQPWGQSGAGAITGTGVPCAPTTPYLNYATPGDGSLTLNFTDGTARPWDTTPVSYEWTHDAGAHWTALTTTPDDGRYSATVTGLTDGTPYTVAVRAVGGANTVPSAASNTQTATPYQPTGAPTGVVVTTGPQSLTATWRAPSQTTPAVAGYEVDYSWGEAGDQVCQVDATTFTCTKTVLPGRDYAVQVYSLDADGRRGDEATATAGAVPFSLTVPASDGALTPTGSSASSLAVGKKITLTGSGYAPNSTVTVLVYSTPQVLTTVVTDASGSFTVEVTVPAGLPAGHHTLVASGVDPGGNLRTMTLPVTVVGGTTGQGGLAYTGVAVAPLLGGGVTAVALGAGLLVLSRRRRTVS